MVRQIQEENKNYFQCEECGHFYEEEGLAQECESWCRKNRSCNLEIIKKAVNKTQLKRENKILIFLPFIALILSGLLISFVLFRFPISVSEQNFNNLFHSNSNNNNSVNISKNKSSSELGNKTLLAQIQNKVLPKEGFKTKLVLGNIVTEMVACGVVDLEKLNKLYNNQVPEFIQRAIKGNNEPIVINQETAGYLLNLFWPLGLSNKTEFNKNIPFSERDLSYLASTGGWWLGKADNGAEYFNKCEIVKLTPQQEEIVYRVAQNTYRPCCNNSTFAQDCNHGSALLGALELAASQGYNEDELYKLALKLNSFWFPDTYLKIAAYFKLTEGKDWEEVDPKIVMSSNYSSISGFINNVEGKLANLNIPQFQGGAGCGL